MLCIQYIQVLYDMTFRTKKWKEGMMDGGKNSKVDERGIKGRGIGRKTERGERRERQRREGERGEGRDEIEDIEEIDERRKRQEREEKRGETGSR